MFFWLNGVHPLVYMYFPYISIALGLLVLVLIASLFKDAPVLALVVGHIFPVVSYLSYREIIFAEGLDTRMLMGLDFVYSYRIIPFLAAFTVLYYITSTISFLLSKKYMKGQTTEFVTLMLATYGASVLVITANSLIVLYLAIELLAILSYIMMGMFRPNKRTLEAVLKYFLMGLVGTAFMLMGLSILMYVAPLPNMDIFRTIATILQEHDYNTNTNYRTIYIIGFVLFMAGLLFKIAVVPFHAWSVDVYQAIPSSLLIFVGLLPKLPIIIFIMFIYLNINLGGLVESREIYMANSIAFIMLFVVILSLALPPVMALVQTSVKRLLGFSSIFNVGVIMMMILAGASDTNVLAYIFAYTIGLTGALMVIHQIECKHTDLSFDNLTGLFYRSKFYAIAMTTFLFSMLGMPLTMGFWVKIAAIKNIVYSDGNVSTLIITAFLVGTIVLITAYVRTVGTMFFYATGAVVEYSDNNSNQHANAMKTLLPTNKGSTANTNKAYETITFAEIPTTTKVGVSIIATYIIIGAVYPNAITLYQIIV